MADPIFNDGSTPPPTPSRASFVSRPTTSLTLSPTPKRGTIVSLHPEYDPVAQICAAPISSSLEAARPDSPILAEPRVTALSGADLDKPLPLPPTNATARSQPIGHRSISKLPIGPAHPHVHIHPHCPPTPGSSSLALHSPATNLSAPALRRETQREPQLETGMPPSSFTRARSHSSVIPAMQFHLPTGMIHRSQSHAQLRKEVLASADPYMHHPPVTMSSLSLSGGAGVAAPPSKSVVCPAINRTRMSHTSESPVQCHIRQTSQSSCRNAVYFESDIGSRLGELLLLAKEETERRVVEEDESEEGTVEAGKEGRDRLVNITKDREINQQIASPPNTPATAYFGSVGSRTPSVAGASTGSLDGGGLSASPEAGSSRVYVGSNPISQNHSILNITRDVVVDSVEAFDAAHDSSPFLTPTPPEPTDDEEWMEEALAVVRELAVEDRMVWNVRRSLEVFDDCWSVEDEELGVGVFILDGVPRMSVQAPYGPHDGNRHGFGNGHNQIQNGSLAPPSKWSLTSSIDEDNRTSLEGKRKKDKKRRSFVPFISGDKDKEADGGVDKENGTIGKKRSRLASFISRLSSVGLGGSGSNSPSTRAPPMPTLSTSHSTNALSTLFSVSPSSPALTRNFSTSSRSSSPAPPDPAQLQRQVAEDSNSSPSSSARRVVISLDSTPPDSATPPRPLTPPRPTIPAPRKTFRRPIPPGIIIPPLPNYPPPNPPQAVPLGKAFSEGMITTSSHVSPLSPCSSSTADSLSKHVTFSSSLLTPSSSPRNEQASMTLPSALRRSVLTKSASASVLGLHQQLKSLTHLSPADTAAGSYFDDSLAPPTPTSMASTDDYGEVQRRDDINDYGQVLQPNRPRLRAMASLGALPLNPSYSKSKGGFKGFVGRLTGRGKSSSKTSPDQLHILPSFLDNDSDLPTPTARDSQKTPTPKHSPSGSFATSPGAGSSSPAGGGGIMSGLKSYLEKAPFRQT